MQVSIEQSRNALATNGSESRRSKRRVYNSWSIQLAILGRKIIVNNFLRRLASWVSRVFPQSVWEMIERVAAYLQGKGAGSNSVDDEVRAVFRLVTGNNLMIFDIGANKGDWAEAALSLFGGRIARIYLFEPSPHNIALLQRQFKGEDRISIVPLAVSDREGEVDLFSDTPGSGMASLYQRKLDHFNISLDQPTKVRTTTLDSFMNLHQIHAVDVMKMDIEGHEFAALKGAEESLKNGVVRTLSFEFGGANIDSRSYFQDYWYFLTSIGYKVSRVLLGGGTYELKNYSEMLECFRTTNYVAARSCIQHGAVTLNFRWRQRAR